MATTHLSAGRLRHRVVIQQQVHTIDANGARKVTWATVAEVWAAVEPLSAKELIQSAAVQSNVVARITIRFRPMTASMRILHRGNVYNIHGVLPDRDSGLEYITLPVSYGLNDGQ